MIGRPQEWNISRKELEALIRVNILSKEDIETITGSIIIYIKHKYHETNN